MCTHPKFVLTGVIRIEKALEGTEIVHVLAVVHTNRASINDVIVYKNT